MRVRRSKDEIIAGIDNKIAYHEELISRLQEKKDKIFSPIKRNIRKISMSKALAALKEASLSPDEIVAMVEKMKKRAKAANESVDDTASE